MSAFSLDHLTDIGFEQFCFDLLGELGFVNINWRKGTGLNSSPSDRGRDIVCDKAVEEVDGSTHLERWFVECKHYKQGVPPDKIRGALAWADAERPDKLVIIASNFLSNPTKDYLVSYGNNNRPAFKIMYWEKPTLEKMTAGKSTLLRKYKVSGDFPFLDIMHPAHILYNRGTALNTLDYLLILLDKLDVDKRDKILFVAYKMVIRPKYRQSVTGDESLAQLRIDELSYEIFKEKCWHLLSMDIIDGTMLTKLIVDTTLRLLFSLGDGTRIDEVITNQKDLIEHLEEEIPCAEPERKQRILGFIDWIQARIRDTPNAIKESYMLYEYFCTNVITPLLVEELELPRLSN